MTRKISGPRRWQVLVSSVALGLAVAATGLGNTYAVTISQTVKSLMGARASTSAFTTVTATHTGVNVATSAESGSAAGSITPSATDASTEVRLAALNAGDYLYSIKFESTSAGDDIPAGIVHARWTVAGAQQTANLAVSAATVADTDKGGFTLVVPGSASDTPEDIQVVFERSA